MFEELINIAKMSGKIEDELKQHIIYNMENCFNKPAEQQEFLDGIIKEREASKDYDLRLELTKLFSRDAHGPMPAQMIIDSVDRLFNYIKNGKETNPE